MKTSSSSPGRLVCPLLPALFSLAVVLLAYGRASALAADTAKPETSSPALSVASASPPSVGESAPNFELTGLDGKTVSLESRVKAGPVVLVMLRGFPGYQCPLCSVQVKQLMEKAQEFASAQARVILVYPRPAQALPERASEFIKGKTLPANFDLLLDPDFRFTNAYHLRWNAPAETAYPAAFVLDRSRKVLFAKVSHSHGDRAQAKDLLAALPR